MKKLAPKQLLELRPKLVKFTAKQSRKRLLSAGAALLLVVAAVAVIATKQPDPKVAGIETYEDYLQGQVDTETGAPRAGRDPASQQQSSLASAASSPTGAGQRVDKPASDVQGDHNTHHSSSDVYGDPNQTGIGVNGCYIDYGVQGQECVPAHAATDGKLTCEGVRTHGGFPNGVKVTGKDRFNLDKNHDGTACGAGD